MKFVLIKFKTRKERCYWNFYDLTGKVEYPPPNHLCISIIKMGHYIFLKSSISQTTVRSDPCHCCTKNKTLCQKLFDKKKKAVRPLEAANHAVIYQNSEMRNNIWLQVTELLLKALIRASDSNKPQWESLYTVRNGGEPSKESGQSTKVDTREEMVANSVKTSPLRCSIVSKNL